LDIAAAFSSQSDKFFGDAPRGVAFTNGFAVVENGEVSLRPHSPKNRVRHGFAFPYVTGHAIPEESDRSSTDKLAS
jgi:hypothetical protein